MEVFCFSMQTWLDSVIFKVFYNLNYFMTLWLINLYGFSLNYRLTEWFGSQGTLKEHVIPTSSHFLLIPGDQVFWIASGQDLHFPYSSFIH